MYPQRRHVGEMHDAVRVFDRIERRDRQNALGFFRQRARIFRGVVVDAFIGGRGHDVTLHRVDVGSGRLQAQDRKDWLALFSSRLNLSNTPAGTPWVWYQ